MEQAESLPQVALAISAYRSDDEVLRILHSVFASGNPDFGAVIVVESLGSGLIDRTAREHGWNVHYINADHNLGSAGNLDLRLRTAAATGLAWCYTVNHDGRVDKSQVDVLARHGSSAPRIGAVYPQLVLETAGGRIDAPRRQFSPHAAFLRSGDDENTCLDVAWSSSNCALYNLDAVREGVSVWPELWMGWEDLALGWMLQERGWVQLRCSDVSVGDNYEYRAVSALGFTTYIAAKPSWYMYYQLRNLIIIARRSHGKALGFVAVARRGITDVLVTLLFRDRKRERLAFLARGLRDGMRGRGGKGPVP